MAFTGSTSAPLVRQLTGQLLEAALLAA